MPATPSPRELPDVSVRRAMPADAAAFASLATQLGYPSSLTQVEKRLTMVMDNPKHLILAAISGNQVVGWAHAYLCCLVETDAFAELGGLVVDGSHRGRGVGARLLEKVEDWARQNGCGAVHVRSNILRHEAHRFYAARGYAQVKTQYAFRKGL